jgi:uncharacterized SAM-binding protein YcdF (DUF218 family)
MSYTEPLLSLLVVLSLLGVVRLPKCKGKTLSAGGLLGLLLVSWPPVDWLLSRPLEMWFPVRPLPASPADAIVVLSSAVYTPQYERPFPLPDQNTYTRCRVGAWLYQHWRPLPVLACGGRGTGRAEGGAPAFAASMRAVLSAAGVPDSSIWTEERSRSTYENALYGAEILRSHGVARIVLVVEAQSMVRAAACFRKQGIAVVPAPSDFRQLGTFSEEACLSWRAVRRNEITLHETLGLLWYWLHGWI